MENAPEISVFPPNLYNMGGPNPQNTKNPLFWVGMDWLTLNLQVEWENWDSETAKPKQWIGDGAVKTEGSRCLRWTLEDCAAAAREQGEAVEVPEFGGVIHPGGGKIGGAKYCKYKIERPDCVVLIADAQKYKGDWPNVKVEISGERCLVYPGGAQAAYVSALNWLESLGAHVHKERVSRVDLCADFPGMGTGEFFEAYKRDWWACRANRHHPDISNGISLYFGSGDVTLRIYDKLAEMQNSALRGSPAKYEHMIQKRWGGKEPEQAIRVEYQLRREWLKLHGCDDFDDLVNLAPSFVGYLTGAAETGRWFRFLCAEQDNKHPELNYTHPAWERVQGAFAAVFARPEKLIEIDPDNADIETLLKQAFGVLEAAASNKGFDLPHKPSTAPVKYQFKSYEAFEAWACLMLRNVALGKPEWKFEKKPDYVGNVEYSPEYELFLQKWVEQKNT